MPKKRIFTTPSKLAVDNSFNDDRFTRIRIDVLESDVEARGHGFMCAHDCLEKSKDRFAGVPVLAHVVPKTDKDGNETLDYNGHDYHIEEDKFNDGQGRIIYDELIVGVVSSEGIEVKDNDEGHAVLSVIAYIHKDYSNYVCDILEARGGETAVSAEIALTNVVYDSEKELDVANEIEAFGITLLGADVEPAIPSAKAVMFSAQADARQQQLLSIMQELKESLDKYTNAVSSAQNSGKEETEVMDHFTELLAKYNLTAEQITFDYQNMSDEEMDKAFEELANSNSGTEEGQDDNNSTPAPANTVELSVKMGENTKNLSKSLTDVIYALTDLVNTTYASDGDYWDVEVFDDGSAKSKYVIMCGWYSGKAYKQAWSLSKDGVYALKGEREEIFREWVTEDERDQLNKARNNLAALQAELDECKKTIAKHEAEPEKTEILARAEYVQIAETPEYTELLNNHFDVTKEDLCAKLDSILLAQVRENARKADLSAKTEAPASSGVKLFPTGGETSTGRYGGMFAN